MAIIKPFKAIRPAASVASKVAALPYDVYNRKEAYEVVKNNPLSFLNIDRAETSFDESVNTYDSIVYQKAKELLDKMISDNTLIETSTENYYIYELTMNDRSQTGIVACASIDDYLNNTIKKHEKTREEKEQDRINHVDITSAQTGPIFLAYRANQTISEIVSITKKDKPLYDFISDDKVSHRVWVIDDSNNIKKIKEAFLNINQIYIADGHHRAASAVKVGLKRRANNPNHKGNEEYNYFLSVLFPDEELMIMPYNRVVKDLNGMTKEEFLKKINDSFDISFVGKDAYNPEMKASFGMYLENEWYMLKAKKDILSLDSVKRLDVSILQEHLLDKVLGIKDPRIDDRIDFIGGIRGLSELEKRCNNDMKVAFSMYPTSINELFDVADDNKLMPPKSTWFEPKLRSGLFIHKI